MVGRTPLSAKLKHVLRSLSHVDVDALPVASDTGEMRSVSRGRRLLYQSAMAWCGLDKSVIEQQAWTAWYTRRIPARRLAWILIWPSDRAIRRLPPE
jgi:hypothetical protein